jgi:predicted component of viral defense system (DUF524 family)
MGRVALNKTKTLVTIIIVVVIVGLGSWALAAHLSSGDVQTVVNGQHQITQISYKGQNGVNALKLLERYANVKVTHYSFGDYVSSINGTAGNGPKYWILYVNGKESSVGASDYITKNSDTLKWRLET